MIAPAGTSIVYGAADNTVIGQDAVEFGARWRHAGGVCHLLRHAGGHYSPPADEIERIERAQASFLGLSTRDAAGVNSS